MNTKTFFHFSIDDVIESLIDISDNHTNIFNNSLFQFIKYLHDKYNVNTDLYCFYQKIINNKLRTLADVSDLHKSSFKKNKWIRLGPHGLDYEHPPYAQPIDLQIDTLENIYSEISRFGCIKNSSTLLRLHYFSESYELAEYFTSKGVNTLLTTDKTATLWRLPKNLKSDMHDKSECMYNGMKFVRSHIRSEKLVEDGFSKNEIISIIDKLITQYGFVTLLTHEYELVRPEVREMTIFVIQYLIKKGIHSI